MRVRTAKMTSLQLIQEFSRAAGNREWAADTANDVM
jgi:hypothetical protein